jgi:uncharacterized protein YybS (DUF2232 family)
MLFKIQDTSDEVYHINPQNIIYVKERPNHGLWKIAVVNGETIMTKDRLQAKILLDFLSQNSPE